MECFWLVPLDDEDLSASFRRSASPGLTSPLVAALNSARLSLGKLAEYLKYRRPPLTE